MMTLRRKVVSWTASITVGVTMTWGAMSVMGPTTNKGFGEQIRSYGHKTEYHHTHQWSDSVDVDFGFVASEFAVYSWDEDLTLKWATWPDSLSTTSHTDSTCVPQGSWFSWPVRVHAIRIKPKDYAATNATVTVLALPQTGDVRAGD